MQPAIMHTNLSEHLPIFQHQLWIEVMLSTHLQSAVFGVLQIWNQVGGVTAVAAQACVESPREMP